MCAALVDELAKEGPDIHVYDDGSDEPFEHEAATVHRYDENGTATWWFLRVTDMLSDAFYDESWKYMLWAPDDIMPVKPNVLGRLRVLMDRLTEKDPEAVCINPITLRFHPVMSWTGFEPIRRHGLWQTQWMDCCGFVDRRFVNAALTLVRQVRPKYKWHGHTKGTGVGKACSIACHSRGHTLYQTKETWFSHGDHPSALAPEIDKSFAVTP